MKKLRNLAIFILMIITMLILSTKAEATTAKINTETARIRKEASTTSTIIEQLDKNEEVEVLEKADGWCKIQITKNGEKINGYISESLLDIKEEDAKQEEENATTNEISNEVVNENEQEEPVNQDIPVANEIKENEEYELSQEIGIKLLPLINSNEKGKISGKIKVYEIINDWGKIENDTISGWARINTIKSSLTEQEKNEENTTVVPEEENNQTTETTTQPEPEVTENVETEKVIKTGYVNTESLKVRKEASKTSAEIDSLKLNDQVSILEETDGWYKIKISGQIGYVASKYISSTKTTETTSRGEISREEEKISTEEKKEESSTIANTTGTEVVNYAKQYLKYKYVSGGETPDTGFDCSGFTKYVYKHFGITLSRSSSAQAQNGVAVEKSELQAGDLLIFNGDSNTSVGHVGIYMGDGNFIHASNPKDGVKITGLSTSYYKTRYVGARRVI